MAKEGNAYLYEDDLKELFEDWLLLDVITEAFTLVVRGSKSNNDLHTRTDFEYDFARDCCASFRMLWNLAVSVVSSNPV